MFIASGDNSWIGGVYYVKNMLYSLVSNEKAMKEFNIYLYIDKNNHEVFEVFKKYSNIYFIYKDNSRLTSLMNKITSKFLRSSFSFELVKYCSKFDIRYIYPVTNRKYLFLKKESVHWIPDFQHVHLKHLFSKKELTERDKIFEIIAREHSKLILSSHDSYNDYIKLFPQHETGVYVVPFVSAIDETLIKQNTLEQVLRKYEIPDKYFFLPNQFWMHKNHMTVFKAINKLVNEQKINIHVICTGNTSDFRNKVFFSELTDYIQINKLSENIHILGFINRNDQIELMKGAIAIIQPSLFEGWGTVVEDAKALQQRIVLSDINVHFEQKNDECYIFPRMDHDKLADILKIMNEKGIINRNFNGEYIETMSKKYGTKIYEIFSN